VARVLVRVVLAKAITRRRRTLAAHARTPQRAAVVGLLDRGHVQPVGQEADLAAALQALHVLEEQRVPAVLAMECLHLESPERKRQARLDGRLPMRTARRRPAGALTDARSGCCALRACPSWQRRSGRPRPSRLATWRSRTAPPCHSARR